MPENDDQFEHVPDTIGPDSWPVTSAPCELDSTEDNKGPELMASLGREEHGPGKFAQGRYEILGEIARGGMGAVLHGRDTDLNRELAIKVLLEKFANNAEVLGRFVDEAQIGGQLQHPGIVPVYELGQFPDKRPFFAMKLVRGQTLFDLLKMRKSAKEDLPRFLKIFEQMCETMAYAHSMGVIHRDLKPLNVMVGAFGEVQVMDWGLAKILRGGSIAKTPGGSIPADKVQTRRSEGGIDATQHGSFMGTAAFMPPEQAHGDLELLDERADVFALGSILCQILTGAPAYTGTSTHEIVTKAVVADLRDMRIRLDASGAERELISVAATCLEKNAGDRPRDASQVAKLISSYLLGVQERLRAAELSRAEATARAETEKTRADAEKTKRKFTVALAASIFLAVTIGGSIWTVYRLDRDRRFAQSYRLFEVAQSQGKSRLDEARRTGIDDLAAWDRAVAAAENAKAVLAGQTSDPELLELSNSGAGLISEIKREQADAKNRAEKRRENRRFLLALDKARLEESRVRNEQSFRGAKIRVYIAEFAKFINLLPPFVPDNRAVTLLRDQEGVEQIAAALDDWSATEPHREVDLKAQLSLIAQQIDPDVFRNKLRLAIASNDKEGLRSLAKAQERESLPAVSVCLLAKSIADLDRDSAIALLTQARQRYPKDFWINFDLGNLLANSGPSRFPDAIRFLTAAATLRPECPDALLLLSRVLSRDEKNIEEVIALCREAIRLIPNYAVARVDLGDALTKQGQLDEAIGEYRAALKFKPDSVEAHAGLGNALKARGKGDEAHFHFGTAARHRGQLDEAIREYREALNIQPDYAEALCNLGFVLQTEGSYSEALVALRRGHELGSKQPDWQIPSADWVRNCENLVKLELRLLAILKGEQTLTENAERLTLAQFGLDTHRYMASVQLFDQTLANDPGIGDSRTARHRYNAACGAVLAAAGRDRDNPNPDEATRRDLRTKARVWLAEELAEWSKSVESGKAQERAVVAKASQPAPHTGNTQKDFELSKKNADEVATSYSSLFEALGNRDLVAQTLEHWKQDSDLETVRNPNSLAKLPDDEKKSWQALWSLVDQFLKKLKMQ